jgi:glycerol kinase
LSSLVVAIDQGSSATKVLAFDAEGRPVYRASRPLEILRPLPHHAEQDPIHLLKETLAALNEVLSSIFADGHEAVCIGLACQRSSFILWDRSTGKPFFPVISWQDVRAKDVCGEFGLQRAIIYERTGLPLTGHYGGPKFFWLLKNIPDVSRLINRKEVTFTPWNSFLLWHLTEERVCVTDESIAGRTLFFNIRERQWDEELLHLFKIPPSVLPEICLTCQLYGHYRFGNRSIPIVCSIGDHQGALLGLGGFQKARCAINYGTSAGVLVNIGLAPHIVKGLLSNIAYSNKKEVFYAAEGTVNAAGSLFEWFGKERGMPVLSRNWEGHMAPSSGGWFMVPGMYGIAAPYWRESVTTEFVGPGEVPPLGIQLRAGMESIAFLVADILNRLQTLTDFKIDRVTAAGGAARRTLLQFQADLLGIPIHHSTLSDATALGCAFLTGLQMGFWKDKKEIERLGGGEEGFYPQISASQREKLLNRWHEILKTRDIIL